MAKKISELPTMLTVTNGDYLVVNDGDTDTRKIEFSNFASKFVRTDGSSTVTGDLTLVNGTLTCQNLSLDSNLLFVDANNGRIGIGTNTPSQLVDVAGSLNIGNGAALRLSDVTNSYAVTFQAPTLTASSSYALPEARPTATASALACGPDGDMYWMPTDGSTVSGAQVVSMVNSVPTSSGSAGQKGQIAVDGTYLYVCRATNVWVRIDLDATAW